VLACKRTGRCVSPKVKKVAEHISEEDARDFARKPVVKSVLIRLIKAIRSRAEYRQIGEAYGLKKPKKYARTMAKKQWDKLTTGSVRRMMEQHLRQGKTGFPVKPPASMTAEETAELHRRKQASRQAIAKAGRPQVNVVQYAGHEPHGEGGHAVVYNPPLPSRSEKPRFDSYKKNRTGKVEKIAVHPSYISGSTHGLYTVHTPKGKFAFIAPHDAIQQLARHSGISIHRERLGKALGLEKAVRTVQYSGFTPHPSGEGHALLFHPPSPSGKIGTGGTGTPGRTNVIQGITRHAIPGNNTHGFYSVHTASGNRYDFHAPHADMSKLSRATGKQIEGASRNAVMPKAGGNRPSGGAGAAPTPGQSPSQKPAATPGTQTSSAAPGRWQPSPKGAPGSLGRMPAPALRPNLPKLPGSPVAGGPGYRGAQVPKKPEIPKPSGPPKPTGGQFLHTATAGKVSSSASAPARSGASASSIPATPPGTRHGTFQGTHDTEKGKGILFEPHGRPGKVHSTSAVTSLKHVNDVQGSEATHGVYHATTARGSHFHVRMPHKTANSLALSNKLGGTGRSSVKPKVPPSTVPKTPKAEGDFAAKQARRKEARSGWIKKLGLAAAAHSETKPAAAPEKPKVSAQERAAKDKEIHANLTAQSEAAKQGRRPSFNDVARRAEAKRAKEQGDVNQRSVQAGLQAQRSTSSKTTKESGKETSSAKPAGAHEPFARRDWEPEVLGEGDSRAVVRTRSASHGSYAAVQPHGKPLTLHYATGGGSESQHLGNFPDLESMHEAAKKHHEQQSAPRPEKTERRWKMKAILKARKPTLASQAGLPEPGGLHKGKHGQIVITKTRKKDPSSGQMLYHVQGKIKDAGGKLAVINHAGYTHFGAAMFAHHVQHGDIYNEGWLRRRLEGIKVPQVKKAIEAEFSRFEKAMQKDSKEHANYREGNKNKCCGECEYFDGKDGCSKVTGRIEPEDLCDWFEREGKIGKAINWTPPAPGTSITGKPEGRKDHEYAIHREGRGYALWHHINVDPKWHIYHDTPPNNKSTRLGTHKTVADAKRQAAEHEIGASMEKAGRKIPGAKEFKPKEFSRLKDESEVMKQGPHPGPAAHETVPALAKWGTKKWVPEYDPTDDKRAKELTSYQVRLTHGAYHIHPREFNPSGAQEYLLTFFGRDGTPQYVSGPKGCPTPAEAVREAKKHYEKVTTGWIAKAGPIAKAVLTAAKRHRLKDSQFGLPGKEAYPMPDKSHAANAKARATQMRKKGKLSAAEDERIDRKANRVLGKSVEMEKSLDWEFNGHHYNANSPEGGKYEVAPRMGGGFSAHHTKIRMEFGRPVPGHRHFGNFKTLGQAKAAAEKHAKASVATSSGVSKTMDKHDEEQPKRLPNHNAVVLDVTLKALLRKAQGQKLGPVTRRNISEPSGRRDQAHDADGQHFGPTSGRSVSQATGRKDQAHADDGQDPGPSTRSLTRKYTKKNRTGSQPERVGRREGALTTGREEPDRIIKPKIRRES
jgi:hypothetical protein